MKEQTLSLEQNIKQFKEKGFSIIKNVVPSEICQKCIGEMQNMKLKSGFNEKEKELKEQERAAAYFDAGEGNQITYFWDQGEKDGSIKTQSLVKAGHNIHMKATFKDINNSQIVKNITQKLNLEPLVVQSMVLQKLPMKGGRVKMHQDSSYLICQPDTVMTWWIPLQDVNKQNGCIWAVPNTHTSEVFYQIKYVNGQKVFQAYSPMKYDQDKCQSIQMKQGDLLIFNGRLLHTSLQNLSDKSRFAYTWHIIDKKSKWDEGNWRSYEEITTNQ